MDFLTIGPANGDQIPNRKIVCPKAVLASSRRKARLDVDLNPQLTYALDSVRKLPKSFPDKAAGRE